MKYLSRENLLFYVIPMVFFVVMIILDYTLTNEQHIELIYHEVTGFIEYFQVAGALFGAYFAILLLRKSIQVQDKGLIVWFILGVLGCIYVSGEELSWGQHFFGWATSEEWALINDQNETNLHNTSAWFDQKPRLILELGIIVGGLIWPFLVKFKKVPGFMYKGIFAFFVRVMPDTRLWLIALLGETVMFSERIVEAAFGKAAKMYLPFDRPSEVHETYMMFFVLCYMYALYINEVYKKRI